MLFLTQSPKMLDALKFAEEHYAKHFRKFTNEPYIIHPIKVTSILASITASEDTLISALLHDVIELNPEKYNFLVKEIEKRFGKTVLKLVLELTNPSEIDASCFELIRPKRKSMDLDHLRKACSTAKIIKLADMIDNLSTMEFDDGSFRFTYLSELGEKMKECEGLNSILFDRLLELYRKA